MQYPALSAEDPPLLPTHPPPLPAPIPTHPHIPHTLTHTQHPPAGEQGLKKLARALDAAVCSCHNLLTDHLQPQLEQLAFRLGELRGLALCLPWRRTTGLQPEQASSWEAWFEREMKCRPALGRERTDK